MVDKGDKGARFLGHHATKGAVVVGVFEILESDHESGGQSGRTVVFAVKRCVGFIEALPVHEVGESAEWMIEVELGVESGLEELKGGEGGGGGVLGLHGEIEFARFWRKTLGFLQRPLQIITRKRESAMRNSTRNMTFSETTK